MYNRTSERYRRKKKRQRLLLGGALILLVLAVLFVLFFRGGSPDLQGSMKLMAFSATDSYAPYSEGVVYLTGNTVSAIDKNQELLFETRTELAEPKFITEGDIITIYNGQTMQVLNLKGETLFTTNLETIQYVRACATNVAAMCIDAEGNQTIHVFDLQGNELNVIDFTHKLLDFGFAQGDMLWSLVLDTTNVNFTCRITTYKNNGGTINGITNIDSQIVQELLFSSTNICAVGTNHIISCNYIGETQETELIYGWELLDSMMDSKEQPIFLLSPRGEDVGTPVYTAARVVILGSSSESVQLPADCNYLMLGDNQFYAFTPTAMYTYDLNCNQKSVTELPFEAASIQPAYDGYVFLSNGVEVYLAKLS